jgi:hypothetical protein
MSQTPADSNRDTQFFRLALFEWNCQKTGSANTAAHKPEWRLSPAEWSEVASLAQRFKEVAELARRR